MRDAGRDRFRSRNEFPVKNEESMRTTQHGVEDGGDFENVYHMRLLDLLKELA